MRTTLSRTCVIGSCLTCGEEVTADNGVEIYEVVMPGVEKHHGYAHQSCWFEHNSGD